MAGIAVLVTSLAVGVASAAAPVIKNGGFETGNLNGWISVSNDSVKWKAYKGTSLTPMTPIHSPPQGTYAAGAVQNAPGEPVLFQDFKVPSHATLKLTTYYTNEAPEFATPPTLEADHSMGEDQQYRIDLIRPNSPTLTLNKGDILKNVFRTKVGDPNTLPPTKVVTNLSSLAGKRVRLRFVAAVNSDPLNAAVDGVKVITSNGH